MVKPTPAPEFVTPRDVAALLCVDRQTVVHMTQDGRLASIRLGSVIRIPTFEVERLREEARKAVPGAKQSQRGNIA